MTTGRKLRNPGKTCSRNGSLTNNKPAGDMVDGRIFSAGKRFYYEYNYYICNKTKQSWK